MFHVKRIDVSKGRTDQKINVFAFDTQQTSNAIISLS